MMRSVLFFITVSLMLCVTSCSTGRGSSQVIIMQGEVNRPGEYQLTGEYKTKKEIPYILVLLGARGYTDNADASKVIVERNGKSVILDLSIPVTKEAPHLAEKFILHANDIVTVPKIKR